MIGAEQHSRDFTSFIYKQWARGRFVWLVVFREDVNASFFRRSDARDHIRAMKVGR